MARTVKQIFDVMCAEALAEATAAGNQDAIDMFSNTSRVAVWRILYWGIAYAQFTLEKLYDATIQRILDIIANLLPHSKRWYRTKLLNFQFGFNLLPDSDKFDNAGYTDAQIEASKVIKYASINEATVEGRRALLAKIAVDVSGEPAQAPQEVEDAVVFFLSEVKDAGVNVILYNRLADLIRCTVNVYYNPLLLDENGNRLDGISGKPIETAAKAFPFELDFNGEFIIAQFVDAIQSAYGVGRRRVDLQNFEKKTGNNAYAAVGSSFVPDAGYAKFDVNGLTINYLPDVVG